MFESSRAGCIFGIYLVVALSLAPIFRPQPALAAAGHVSSDACSHTYSNDPDVQSLFELRCSIHATIFDDGEGQSYTYTLDDAISQPGLYSGWNHDDKAFDLELAHVVEADLSANPSNIDPARSTLHFVAGTMVGPQGQVAIAGIMFHNGSAVEDHALFVSSLLQSHELAALEHGTAILDGPIISETVSGPSGPGVIYYPIATATSIPSVLTADCANLSVISGTGGGVDPACVQAAFDTYNGDMDEAKIALCLTLANAGQSVCLLGCGAALLVPAAGWVGAGICVADCLALGAIAFVGCYAAYSISLNSTQARLENALRACGVIIVED